MTNNKIIGAAVLLIGCQSTTPRFICTTDPQCIVSAKPVAKCVKTGNLPGACAFPSTTCPSEYVYDESATDGRGKQCVQFSDALGFSWVLEDSGVDSDFQDVWASSKSDVYAVGTKGTILHSQGDGVWKKQNSGVATTSILKGVWGSSDRDIYVVGGDNAQNGIILHSTVNGVWSPQINSAQTLWSIWGSSATDIYAAGNDYKDGMFVGNIARSTTLSGWGTTTTNASLYDIWGSGSTNVYSVGFCLNNKCEQDSVPGDSVIFHSTSSGGSFTPEIIPKVQLVTVHGNQAGDYYLGGRLENQSGVVSGRIYKLAEGKWKLENDSLPEVANIWVSPTGELFIVHRTSGTISYSDGAVNWTTVSVPGSAEQKTVAVWGTGPNDIYLVGLGSTVIHGRR